jgi:hypothetical protein
MENPAWPKVNEKNIPQYILFNIFFLSKKTLPRQRIIIIIVSESIAGIKCQGNL